MTKLIRSKNAGPFELTFDIIFRDSAGYRKVRDAGLISPAWVARAYRLEPVDVAVIHYDPANAIKVTIPRASISGDIDDSDVYGGQQYAHFVNLDVP